MFAFGIILSMVIFGGLVALLGDRVGMKVGKKRLTIFGLRPKYTSMIITVLTGFFIAGLTLVILMIMSQYVRTAIFSLHSIQVQLKNTTAKVVRLNHEVEQKEAEYIALTGKYQGLQTEYQVLHDQYQVIHTNLTKAIAERTKVQLQLDEAQQQYQIASTNLATTKTELDLAQNRMNNLSAINDDLKNQIASLTLQETRLNQQIENLEGWMKTLEDQNKNIADKPVIFFVGEILVSKITEPGIATEKAFSSIVEPILKEANKVAMNRGARIPGKSDYGLRVAPRRVADICSQLGDLKSKAVLRVLIDKNSVVGEPAIVTLDLFPNQLIYKQGEKIMETIVSCDEPESKLGDKILNLFILSYNKAIENGIITDAPNLRDLISISDVVEAINQIKAIKEGQVKLAVVAADNIYRVDPFKVKFEVTE